MTNKHETKDTNVYMMPGKKQKEKKVKKPKQTVSKKQLRRIKQMMLKKKKQTEQKVYLERIAKAKLDQEELALFQGKEKESRKTQIKRAEKQRLYGLELSDELKKHEKRIEKKFYKETALPNGELSKEAQEEVYYHEAEEEQVKPKESESVTPFLTLDFSKGFEKMDEDELESSSESSSESSDDDGEQVNLRKRKSDDGEQVNLRKRKREGDYSPRKRQRWKGVVEREFENLCNRVEEQFSESSEVATFLSLIKSTKQALLQNSPVPMSDQDESLSDQDESMNGVDRDESMNEQGIQQPNLDCNLVKETETEIIQRLLNQNDTQQTGKDNIKKTKFYVHVERKEEIQKQRMELPIAAQEQEIMEQITDNDVVIICGETGSGKTTQIPQFLYEAGYSNDESGFPGLIGITQPRRVAAISTAKRVAEELNSTFGELVSYQVRYSHNMSEKTQIKFMTDGILLKEIQQDVLLMKYSALILDEAHERNVNTDILIGLLSRLLPERNRRARLNELHPQTGKLITPLKLIIMSATLRVDDFMRNEYLFPTGKPALIDVQSRQYPVTAHFNRRTNYSNYVEASISKVKKIHEKLPPGGILVFLTGKSEIDFAVNKLKSYAKKLSNRRGSNSIELSEKSIDDLGDLSEDDTYEGDMLPDLVGEEEVDDKTQDRVEEKDEGPVTVTLFESDQNNAVLDFLSVDMQKDLHVLPLYSMLHPKDQLKVFQSPPPGKRLCVVATNVAETSLTIPGIRYVVDCGRVKDKEFDSKTGVSKFVIKWISKAGASQRAGRAGRTGPGHCYRLYSSAVYDQKFKSFFDPEIVKIPIDNVVLSMKAMGIDNIQSFPLPTPPDPILVRNAMCELVHLNALQLDNCTIDEQNLRTVITPIGKQMNEFPLNPRYAKMILMAIKTVNDPKMNCLSHILAIVSLMTVEFVFLHSMKLKEIRQRYEQSSEELQAGERRKKMTFEDKKMKDAYIASRNLWRSMESDFISELKAMGAYQFENESDSFCNDHLIHSKNMKEALKLMKQLTRIVKEKYPDLEIPLYRDTSVAMLKPPTPHQQICIRQVLCSSFVDHVARKVKSTDDLDNLQGLESLGKLTERNYPYVTLKLGHKVPVFIHPSSYLSGQNPDYIVYKSINQTQKGRYYMQGITAVNPKWLCTYGKSLTTFSDILTAPPPRYSNKHDVVQVYVKARYGQYGEWELPPILKDLDFASDLSLYLHTFSMLFLKGKIFKSMTAEVVGLGEFKQIDGNCLTTSRRATRFIESIQSIMKTHNVECISKAVLNNEWQLRRNTLKLEYLAFVPEEQRSLVQWPPI